MSSPADRTVPFANRIREIRQRGGEQRHAGRKLREAARQEDRERLLASFERVEAVEGHITGLARQLAAELPTAARFTRSFYDGGWRFSLAFDELVKDEAGAPAEVFSRLDVHLGGESATGALDLVVRATVRDRDLPTERLSDETDDELVEAWLLQRFLDFARAYFGGGALPHPSSS